MYRIKPASVKSKSCYSKAGHRQEGQGTSPYTDERYSHDSKLHDGIPDVHRRHYNSLPLDPVPSWFNAGETFEPHFFYIIF